MLRKQVTPAGGELVQEREAALREVARRCHALLEPCGGAGEFHGRWIAGPPGPVHGEAARGRDAGEADGKEPER